MMTSISNMAKGRRGPTVDGEAAAQDVESSLLAAQSSDDEAPEVLSFEESRARALDSVRKALDSVRREKEQLKEQRRKRQELFQEQKKRKLLPADVLEEIDPVAPSKQKPSDDQEADAALPTNPAELHSSQMCPGSAEEEQSEDDDKSDETRTRKKKKRKHIRQMGESCTVMTVKGESSISDQHQAALDFLQSRLYGPGSCRTSCNELLSLQKKTGQMKGAAVQFVKKDWACKQKAKAEMLRKRWIQKQQLPPS